MKITQINRFKEDKNGIPLRTSAGKPYERVTMRVQEYGDQMISGFGNEFNSNWKAGDEVDIEVEKVEKGQNTYLNFKRPDPLSKMKEQITALQASMVNLEKRMYALESTQTDRNAPSSGFGHKVDPEYQQDFDMPTEEELRESGL